MASPGTYIAVCTEFDAGGACTSSAWVPYTGNTLPNLSIEEAAQIGTAIALLWAGAWVFKQLLRFIREM